MALRDSQGYQTPIDSRPSGRDWLEDFRKDLHSVLFSLADWKEMAVDTMYAAMDCNDGGSDPLSVPFEFKILTDIIALWCDAELHVDPTALTEVRRHFLAFQGGNRAGPGFSIVRTNVPMSDDEMEAMMHKAMDVFERVRHATLARFSTEQQEKVVLPDGPKPAEFEFGPISGQKKDLSRWYRGQSMENDRILTEMHGTGIWIVRKGRYCFELWFNRKAEFERVKQIQEATP